MPKSGKHSLAAPVGAVILALALVGAIFLCSTIWKAASGVLDSSRKNKELESLLLPILMFDPAPFDSVETADPTMLLQSSIWAAVLGDTTGKYTIELGESLSVPETDVDAAAARLFGPDVKLSHKTFGELDQNYYYNENTHLYHIPLYTQIGYYIPRLVAIDKQENDVYSLTVGYVSPNSILVTVDTDDQEPDKYMMYDVKYNKEKKIYYVLALRNMSRDETTSSPAA